MDILADKMRCPNSNPLYFGIHKSKNCWKLVLLSCMPQFSRAESSSEKSVKNSLVHMFLETLKILGLGSGISLFVEMAKQEGSNNVNSWKKESCYCFKSKGR